MPHKPSVLLTPERDIPMLRFLWKWKLVTTAALTTEFFPGRHPVTAYNRLWTLERAGMIERRIVEQTKSNYWALSKRGFEVVRDSFAGMKEEGFRSEHVRHDGLVTAFHLGDWLFKAPPGVKFFTEQQLRRVGFESYPPWVPKSESHRPDGYWGIPVKQGIRPVAIEVELTEKTSDAYEELADFYNEEETIYRVLWLVHARATAKRINASFCETRHARSGIHNFVLMSDFMSRCWDAEIAIGPEQKQTVSTFLHSLCGTPKEVPKEWARNSLTHPLLDSRKSYIKSANSAELSKSENSY